MDNQVHNQIVSFIWGIADDCLRDIYVRGKYRDVILPMTVIRRLDAMLEDSKAAVLDMKKKLDAAGIDNQWPALCNVAGQAFCNASPFRLKDLTSRAKKQTLQKDFEAYLDGFSPNVQEILAKFKFRDQIPTMIEADILGAVIEKFVSPDINLSPKPVYKDEAQTILKHPGLDNHGMGTIFEELIRKFNEENNEEAGEHWTPRDVVELMADLVFMPPVPPPSPCAPAKERDPAKSAPSTFRSPRPASLRPPRSAPGTVQKRKTGPALPGAIWVRLHSPAIV